MVYGKRTRNAEQITIKQRRDGTIVVFASGRVPENFLRGCANLAGREGFREIVGADGECDFEPYVFTENDRLEELVVCAQAIARGAFAGCKGLRKVTLQGVSNINAEAFASCGALETIDMGVALHSIGTGAFCGCKSLRWVEVPEALVEAGTRVFYNCGVVETRASEKMQRRMPQLFDDLTVLAIA